MSRFATNKPTTPAEVAAAKAADAKVASEGFTPTPELTFVRDGVVFAASFESAPGTMGAPAVLVSEAV